MSSNHTSRSVKVFAALAAFAVAAALVFTTIAVTNASTTNTVSTSTTADAVNTDRTGLAIGGYDPVAYFTDQQPAKGDFQITHEHNGAVYRFLSEQNRDKFAANPHHYAPQYGGYCAYGVAVDAKFSADPTVWKIVDNKLYLNLDPNIAAKFNEDVPGYIKDADNNWKSLEAKPAR